MTFRPGDIVEVKTPREILETLDGDGTVARLPFMPEMMSYCGRQFRIASRVFKLCASGTGSSTMRAFDSGDVLILEGLRCSGAEHDGCEKDCTILWREAWLRPAGQAPPSNPGAGAESLRARLKTRVSPTRYFCQASELLAATTSLSKAGRLSTCVADVRAGNSTAWAMIRRVAVWLFWRTRRRLLGEYAKGSCPSKTPSEGLALAAGEHVEVKPLGDIADTLNAGARNRGLYFSPDMALHCGRQERVARRVDKIIVDGTGEMRTLHHTVFLENALCGCDHVAVGGCPRREHSYWREIWLRRSSESS